MPSIEADSLLAFGNLLVDVGDIAEACDAYEHALTLYRSLQDRLGESKALGSLGIVSELQSDYGQSRNYYEQNLQMCRELGYRRGESFVLNNLGASYHETGNYLQARHYYEQARALSQELGDKLNECRAMNNIGLLLCDQGHYADALLWCEPTITMAREIGGHELLGSALSNQGHILVGLHDFDAARKSYHEAFALQSALGQQQVMMENLAGLAVVALELGELAEALRWVEPILAYVQKSKLDGSTEAVRVHLSCYRVLLALRDKRAQAAWAAARQLLVQRVLVSGDNVVGV